MGTTAARPTAGRGQPLATSRLLWEALAGDIEDTSPTATSLTAGPLRPPPGTQPRHHGRRARWSAAARRHPARATLAVVDELAYPPSAKPATARRDVIVLSTQNRRPLPSNDRGPIRRPGPASDHLDLAALARGAARRGRSPRPRSPRPKPAGSRQRGRRRQPHRHRHRPTRRSPARPGSTKSSPPGPRSMPLAAPTRPPEP